MGKGQPLKLQPSMLSDSKWMRVLNSIVPNITMIPNGGNRSKLGIDILNKQDSKALASSNEREPDSWNSIPWNCTQTPKQDDEKYQTSTLQFFQPAHVHICDKNNLILPNLSYLSTNNPWSLWLLDGGLWTHNCVLHNFIHSKFSSKSQSFCQYKENRILISFQSLLSLSFATRHHNLPSST